MTPPGEVVDLVERFEEQRGHYSSGQYNEAQLREEFLNPLFAALGWDVYNRKGYAEAYKEVIHEAAIKVGGRTKAPDYCFRAGGGVRSYFVEASCLSGPTTAMGETASVTKSASSIYRSAGRGVRHPTSNLLSKARTHLHLNPQGGPHGPFARAHATV